MIILFYNSLILAIFDFLSLHIYYYIKIDCKVQVVARKRKFIKIEQNKNDYDIIQVNKQHKQISIFDPNSKDISGKQLSQDNLQSKSFIFDQVFDENSTNEDLYQQTGKQTVDSIFQGYNSTMLAYGQTGSGKTYSIQGNKISNPGMCYRALQDIFSRIQQSDENQFYLVKCSYFEIYNEEIKDLITNKKGVRISDDSNFGMKLVNLTEYNIQSYNQAVNLYEQGQHNRAIGSTSMNFMSSRSHTIFQITIECQTDREDQNLDPLITKGTLSFVDLAGSEQLSKTQAIGKTMIEGNNINLSLSTLGLVIEKLVIHDPYIPYRNSKLTHVLKNSLGGNAKTIMLVCISPASSNYYQSLSSLRYGHRANQIINKAKINEDPKDSEIRKLKDQIKALKNKITELSNNENINNEQQVQKFKQQFKSLVKENKNQKILSYNQQQMDDLQQQLKDFKQQIKNTQKEHKKEVDQLNKQLSQYKNQLQKKDQLIENLQSSSADLQQQLTIKSQMIIKLNKQQKSSNKKSNQKVFDKLMIKFDNLQTKSYNKLQLQYDVQILQSINSRDVEKNMCCSLIKLSKYQDLQSSQFYDIPDDKLSQEKGEITKMKMTMAMFMAYNGIIPPPSIHHPTSLQDSNGFTVAMWLAYNKIIPPLEWQHNPSLQNKYETTVAMLLAVNGILPPQQWQHDSSLKNNKGNTAAMNLAANGIVPPEQWNHNPFIQNNHKCTVAMFLANKKIQPPKQWYHDPNLKSDRDNTVAMYLAQQGIIPNEQWQHDPTLYCKFYEKKNQQKLEISGTVAMLLAVHKIIPPQNWSHNPELLDQVNFKSVFSILVNQQIIPPKEWCATPEFQDLDGNTQAMILATNNLQIPPYLQHKTDIKNSKGQTVALIYALNKQTPPDEWTHNKYIRILYKNKCLTVQNILIQNNQKVPEKWKYEPLNENEDNEMIIQARQGQIPSLPQCKPHSSPSDPTLQPHQDPFYDPSYQNLYGDTVAMILSKNRQIPTKDWLHDTSLTNSYNQSVGIILSQNGVIPPLMWLSSIAPQQFDQIKENLRINCLPVPSTLRSENFDIFDQAIFTQNPQKKQFISSNKQNSDGFTVAMILAANSSQIPKEWEHDPNIRNRYGYTVGLYQARTGVQPDGHWVHNRFYRGFYCIDFLRKEYRFYTVQNFLQLNKKEVGKYWSYDTLDTDEDNETIIQIYKGQTDNLAESDPEYQNIYGRTVAMCLAENKIIPQKQWQHSPYLYDYLQFPVAMILAKNGIMPPKEWMISTQYVNNFNRSLQYYIEHHGYIYQDGEFKINYQIVQKDARCERCNQNKKQFVLLTCNEQLCLDCFESHMKQDNYDRCPICNEYGFWFERINK